MFGGGGRFWGRWKEMGEKMNGTRTMGVVLINPRCELGTPTRLPLLCQHLPFLGGENKARARSHKTFYELEIPINIIKCCNDMAVDTIGIAARKFREFRSEGSS